MIIRNMKSHVRKFWWIYVLLFCVLILASALIYRHVKRPQYWQYESTYTSQGAMLKRSSYQHSSKLEYDFTYRQGCPHCMSIQSTVAPLLKRDKSYHKHLLVLNAKYPSLKHYLITSGQSNVPTTSVRYHGYLLYQYTGTNHKIIKDLLNGINPETHIHFTRSVPKTSIVYDSLTHNHQYAKEPARDTLSY